jgi:NAD(P)-dependent dehydrogenase (short-subunit alcohol dehydrogenase family)
MSLAQQRILIIGGSSGMGLASARQLVLAGADVFIAGRDAERLQAAVQSLQGKAVGVAADCTDPKSLAGLMARVGRLDHLVLAAGGTAAWGPFSHTTPEALRRAFDTKLLGYWQALQAALPILRKDGSVLMLTGAASRVAMNGTAGLAAINGGITQMAQTLARELAPLRVNVISPGLVDTPAYDGMPAEAKAGMFAGAAKSLPVGRVGRSEDIAAAVELLLANTFATGVLLDLDGGARMPL